jgi:hypothetical protein
MNPYIDRASIFQADIVERVLVLLSGPPREILQDGIRLLWDPGTDRDFSQD